MKKQKFQSRQRSCGIVFSALLTFALAGCEHMSSPWDTVNADMPANYQARHPIELATSTASTTINISPGGGIGVVEREQAISFGQAFRSDGEGTLAIGIPVGSFNERQAAGAARDVRQALVAAGISAKALVYRPYKAGAGAASPPLLLSYRRLRTNVPTSCGVVDNLDIDSHNMETQDFGCSTQNNFAAMLANPNDLVTPRPMDNASAARRAATLDLFNKNGNKALTGGSSTAGSASGSGSGSQ
jgi:pilus assembly protein CpaD